MGQVLFPCLRAVLPFKDSTGLAEDEVVTNAGYEG
jgi:hypothetical protein